MQGKGKEPGNRGEEVVISEPENRKPKGNRMVPRVSVIMTTFNSIGHVEATLRSVLEQDYPDLEVVIADGGSSDGTVEVIRKYADMTNNRFRNDTGEGSEPSKSIVWISEPDRGIYDGMNKAIRMSTGDIIGICNDLFTRDDAISLMVRAICHAEEKAARNRMDPGQRKTAAQAKTFVRVIGAHADLAYMEGDRVVRKWVMGEGRIEDGWLPAHPTMYLKREVYEKYGLYDLDYRSSSDYEFMVRVLKHPENRLAYVPVELIHMFYGGTSNAGVRGYLRNTMEAYKALKANEIPHPGLVIAKRIIRTMHQF